MERHPEKLNEGVIRKNGEATPWNAGDAVAATVDVCKAMGIPVAPSIKARLGKAAKGLLGAGFDPRTVVAAMVVTAIHGVAPVLESIAQEMVVAAAGHRRTRHDFQQALAEHARPDRARRESGLATMRAEMARREELTP